MQYIPFIITPQVGDSLPPPAPSDSFHHFYTSSLWESFVAMPYLMTRSLQLSFENFLRTSHPPPPMPPISKFYRTLWTLQLSLPQCMIGDSLSLLKSEKTAPSLSPYQESLPESKGRNPKIINIFLARLLLNLTFNKKNMNNCKIWRINSQLTLETYFRHQQIIKLWCISVLDTQLRYFH